MEMIRQGDRVRTTEDLRLFHQGSSFLLPEGSEGVVGWVDEMSQCRVRFDDEHIPNSFPPEYLLSHLHLEVCEGVSRRGLKP